MARDRRTSEKREPDGSQNSALKATLVQRGKDPSAPTAPGSHQKAIGVRKPRASAAGDARRAAQRAARRAESP